MKKSERTRQFIIEKSAPIFNQKGIAGTSMSDIMEATQMAKGGLYGNFDSKESLSLEVFTFLSNRTHDAVTSIIKEAVTAKEKIHALLDFYDGRLLTRNAGGCPILNFGVEADDTNPQMKQKVNETINRFLGRIEKIIKDGQETGEFSADFDSKLFALKTFTMIEGAVLISKVQNTPDHLHTIIALLKKEADTYIK